MIKKTIRYLLGLDITEKWKPVLLNSNFWQKENIMRGLELAQQKVYFRMIPLTLELSSIYLVGNYVHSYGKLPSEGLDNLLIGLAATELMRGYEFFRNWRKSGKDNPSDASLYQNQANPA